MNDKPFCKNHDVACGNYDCNYADVVNSTIICNAKNCIYQSIYTPIKVELGPLSGKTVFSLSNISEEEKYMYLKLHSGSLYGKSVYALLSNMPDEAFPF